MNRFYFSVAAALLLCCDLEAQVVANKDNTVTFNYRNDNATKVEVDVQFAGRHEMTKGPDGNWTITLGPAAPDLYPYCYVVDGVQVMDPEADGWFPNETFKNSLLDIPGTGEPMIHTLRDVPHGTVDYVNYPSRTLGMYGRAIVYTPPFYDKHPERKYPVMYLISGTTDTEEVYFKVGRMNLILDNLIAEGKAKEMIIVLPYGNPSLIMPSGNGSFMMGDIFGKDLTNDLMPFVEANYRTLNDRQNRGIGGFSRGGNQGLSIGLTNLDKFSWLCSYSSFTSTILPGGIYDDVERLNRDINLFWLGVGLDDFLYGNAKDYMDFLDSKGIRNIKLFTTGKFGHTWMNARYFLDKTFRLLFNDEPITTIETGAVAKTAPAKAAPAKAKSPSADQQRLTPEVMARLFPTPVVSPEYNADGSVTFRFRAPDAKKVELESEMLDVPLPMLQDRQGVWSITVTPKSPDIYRYCFVMDGTRVADAANMYLSPDKGFKYSIADVRGDRPAVQDLQDTAHGKVSYRYTKSGPFCIYTPSGYVPGEKLPVLYLSEGSNDSYESWFKLGKADNIFDNLIAGGLAQRMLVVMSFNPEVEAFVEANYNVGDKVVDNYAKEGHSWMDNRDHLELLATGLFAPRSESAVTNINANGYPRILADNSVIFKFRGPAEASPVIDLCGRRYPMTYTPDGFWTARTAPQVPGFHYYNLIINGISTADPASYSFYGCSRVSSAIEIPEEGCDLFETQDVPHGQVREMKYYSNHTGSWRPILVYTPASYEKGNRKYPVVYIHHGGGEDHRGWMDQGRTAIIMDNLIARAQAEEMIVVSVNSNVPAGPSMRGGYNWEGMQPYADELLNNIIPFVEKTFRVRKDRHSRAMCGLSMGGGQSFYIGLRNPEVFANVGLFSSGIFGGIAGASDFDLEANVPGMLSNTDAFNAGLDNFFISCGEQDPRISHTRNIVEKMQASGIKVKFDSFPGDHEWQVWRKSFAEFAGMLFHK